jgi:hypothetical protein
MTWSYGLSCASGAHGWWLQGSSYDRRVSVALAERKTCVVLAGRMTWNPHNKPHLRHCWFRRWWGSDSAVIACSNVVMFDVDKFFIWSFLLCQIFVLNSHILIFKFLIFFSNNLRWRHILYQSCSAWQDWKLYSWVFFFIWVHLVAKIFDIKLW